MSLATELSSRLIKESFTGTHLMLKVMRRAADAPLDPPKHLGHGKCDTFNKSVQMGVATNNPEALGREATMMMKSLRIPPGELRGIGLQMGKLERAGEVKLEMGQKKLDFSKNPKADIQMRSPKLQQRTSPPPLQPPAPAPPRTPVQATQFIAPTQIDPEVLANLPDDIRARIISRKPVAVQSSQIDEEVFKELPPSIQDELRQTFKKPVVKITPTKKKPSPRKGKSGFGMVGQSKLPISSPDELDKAVLAELPSTIRQEVISNAQREHAVARAAKARRLAWEAERTVRERKITRSVTIPEPPPKPTFQKMSELPELRELIHNWFKEFQDESPAEEDVELLGGYLRKVVLIEKDLRKAEAVVKWFRSCCRDTTGAAQDEWWAAGLRLVEHVNDACMERGVGKIDFDTQGL
jgi:DNA repair protein REV1